MSRTRYAPVEAKSSHGLLSLDDDSHRDGHDDDRDDGEGNSSSDNDEIEIVFDESYGSGSSANQSQNKVPQFPRAEELNVTSMGAYVWNVLTFAWMKPLLALGNTRALEQTDLYPLPHADTASAIYSRFRHYWRKELAKRTAPSVKGAADSDAVDTEKASLVRALGGAFGWPFICAGVLKLIHDSCIFVGPLLLNDLIHLLSDPNAPASLGYYYVGGLFAANFMMSLCLRQYFWLACTLSFCFVHDSLCFSGGAIVSV
jgi:hypothetical protein